MRRSIFTAQEENKDSDSDKYSAGDLDLLDLRLNYPSDDNRRINSESKAQNTDFEPSELRPYPPRRHRHPLRKQDSIQRLVPNLSRVPQGYGKPPNSNPVSSENLVLLYSRDTKGPYKSQDPITTDDFLFPSRRKIKAQAIDAVESSHAQSYKSVKIRSSVDQSGSFPFKQTPSGNLKVNSKQVVFETDKLSVLIADPDKTRVNIERLPHDNKRMAQGEDFGKNSAMDTIMSQAGLSSIGSLIGNTPVRSTNKESSEYESKRTSEILDPELNLGRLGYGSNETINWEKVVLPEKKNLYLELYSRITNYTNADCRVYIDNEEFNCHLLVLQCYSDLFDAYTGVKKVELPFEKCCASSFAFIYEWMITGEPSYKELTRDNVLDIFNAAKYLKIKDLVEQCWAFIDNSEVFSEDTGFLLYMGAKNKHLPEVRELMLPRIQGFFLMLVSSQDWLELELEDVMNLLNSNYVCVNCEMEIFMSAVRWLKHDWTSRDQHKYDVLGCVRFGNIAPWQLVDIKRNPDNPDFMDLAKDQHICKMIDDGLAYVIIKYWYGQENDDFQHWNTVLGLQEPPPRNWSGTDKTYFTYREFLIYLDQYRRNQLIEKNKPKPHDKKPINHTVCPTLTQDVPPPQPPTTEEFLSKKKPIFSNVSTTAGKNCRVSAFFSRPTKFEQEQIVYMARETSSRPATPARRKSIMSGKASFFGGLLRKKPMTEEKAAIVIQSAYRGYRARQSIKQEMMKRRRERVSRKSYSISSETGRSYDRTSYDNRQTKTVNKKIMEMFTPAQNREAKSHMNELSVSALAPYAKNYLTELSLFLPERETVIVFGGVDPHNPFGVGRNTGKDIYRYIPDNNTWEYVGDMPEPRHQHRVQFLKGRVYLAGGSDPRDDDLRGKDVVSDTVWSFEPVKRSWFSEGSLITGRKHFGLVACNQSMYAIGGQDRSGNILNTVERFKPMTSQWELQAPMKYARTGLACCKYRSYIWAAGGLLDKSKFPLTNIVESYDLETNQWTEVTRLQFPRCYSRMFVMSDRLYIIGGAGRITNKDKTTVSISTIAMWDPIYVEWRHVTDMTIPRHGHAVAYLGTQLLIIGGVTTIYMRALSNAECFCTQRGTWVRGLACLPLPLSGHAAVTLPPAVLMA